MPYRVLKEYPGRTTILQPGQIIGRKQNHPRTQLLVENGYIEKIEKGER